MLTTPQAINFPGTFARPTGVAYAIGSSTKAVLHQ
jgi:hypothetical protein